MKPKPFRPIQLDSPYNYFRNETDDKIWHRCQNRTLYIDTDRSQVVYHSHYLRYFEIGRTSLMRDAAYPYREIEETGYVYPIIEIGVRYFQPLYYDDLMWIYTRPSELERVKVRFDYIITGMDNQLICDGFTKHCSINAKGVPVAVDEKTRILWQNFPKP